MSRLTIWLYRTYGYHMNHMKNSYDSSLEWRHPHFITTWWLHAAIFFFWYVKYWRAYFQISTSSWSDGFKVRQRKGLAEQKPRKAIGTMPAWNSVLLYCQVSPYRVPSVIQLRPVDLSRCSVSSPWSPSSSFLHIEEPKEIVNRRGHSQKIQSLSPSLYCRGSGHHFFN